MGGVGEAHGKLILFGEHAAVYGHPAIGLSLPARLTVRLQNSVPGPWRLDTIPEDDRPAVSAVLARLEELVPGVAARERCSVTIDSEVARGVGLGSSAALCVALARAVLEHTESPGGSDATSGAWQLAHQAEQIFHGTPSGIDTGLALHQGLFAFRPQPPGLPGIERLPSPRLWLVSAAVPREGDCRALIGGLAERMRVGDRRVRSAMDELGRIAHEAESLLRSAAPGSLLGRSADAAMEILRGIGLSTPGLEALLAAGRRAGASGGKLSGAGGGGAFYLVAENRELADRVALAVRTEAARAGIPLSAPSLVTSFAAAS